MLIIFFSLSIVYSFLSIIAICCNVNNILLYVSYHSMEIDFISYRGKIEVAGN